MTKVRHPLHDRDASPAAVTVGTSTYSVGDDGTVDCPDDVAEDVADVLAEVHGVAAEDLVVTAEERSPMSLEEMTYDEVYEAAADAGIEGRSSMDKEALIAALRED